MSQEDFIKKIAGTKTILDAVRRTEAAGQKAIGIGGECVVIPHEKDGKLVVAIHYDGLTKEQARLLYYQQRVLSTLFPHNFVPFYMTYPSQDEKGSGITIRAKIEGVGGTSLVHDPQAQTLSMTDAAYSRIMREKKKAELDANEVNIKFPLMIALQQLEEMGFPFEADVFPQNRIIGTDGGEYYVDTSGLFDHVKDLDADTIVQAMVARGYSTDQQDTVRECIDRMKAL